jgi:hypothetical protein
MSAFVLAVTVARSQATVANAHATMSTSPSLLALAKSYEIRRERAPHFCYTNPRSR